MTHPVTLTADIAYGDNPLQVLDLYRPQTDETVPVVLYLHGGGWQVGDKTADAKERLERLASFGIAVASANYRLVPEATYPAQVDDAKRAVAVAAGTRRRVRPGHGTRRRLGRFGRRLPRLACSGSPTTTAPLAGDRDVAGLPGGRGRRLVRAERPAVELDPQLAGEGDPQPAVRAGLPRSRRPVQRRRAGPQRQPAAAGSTRDAPPFLIVHGDRDRVTPISREPRAARRPGARRRPEHVHHAGRRRARVAHLRPPGPPGDDRRLPAPAPHRQRLNVAHYTKGPT